MKRDCQHGQLALGQCTSSKAALVWMHLGVNIPPRFPRMWQCLSARTSPLLMASIAFSTELMRLLSMLSGSTRGELRRSGRKEKASADCLEESDWTTAPLEEPTAEWRGEGLCFADKGSGVA